tara:strand:- start:644 stop:847 length:204 start_codon:yes stop_codon:yes gene_type:complete
MRITLKKVFDEHEYSATCNGEDIESVVESLKGLLVQAGYHPRTVDEYLVTSNQWFDDDQEQVAVSTD